MFGDKRELVLHYFLADDTIEILEKIPPNSGRDAISMFLRRARLPKDLVPLHQPGVQTKRTVLNVFGPTGHGGRYILDSLKVKFNIIQRTLCAWGRFHCEGEGKDFPLGLTVHTTVCSPFQNYMILCLYTSPLIMKLCNNMDQPLIKVIIQIF